MNLHGGEGVGNLAPEDRSPEGITFLSYRQRIYENFASRFQDAPESLDFAEVQRWGKAYDYRFRGWLPARKEAAIVDLACGGGKLLYFFKQRGYQVLSGVDISPEQVMLARQVVPEVIKGNVLDFLEAHPQTFDLLTGLDIIEHFHKDEVLRFLDLCHAALRPGGRLILQTPNAESFWGCMHRYNDFTHEIAFNPNLLRRLLALCGFKEIEARETGPIPLGHSAASTVRYIVWQGFRGVLKLWNLAEGHTSSGVFTRTFLVSGVK
jgi:2-polyprenyl-3-methyl-5-hydroxy-6-metoxy-1,4-benzoquinol methylase